MEVFIYREIIDKLMNVPFSIAMFDDWRLLQVNFHPNRCYNYKPHFWTRVGSSGALEGALRLILMHPTIVQTTMAIQLCRKIGYAQF